MYESNRILVQMFCIVMTVFAGCSNDSSVPVSIKQQPPYSYQGDIGRMWGGDNFEIVSNNFIHYAFIRGIDTPEPGQPFHDEAKWTLWRLAENKQANVHVIDRDAWKREICDVTINDPATNAIVDPAVELLNSGLAWYDLSDGPYAERYRDAQAKAKEKGIGIWSESDPVPPWEFWEQNVKSINQSIDQ
jgi:endonuclease YncB( thermonuclease family)